MKKKYLSLLTAVFIVSSMTACGENKQTSDDTDNSEDIEVTEMSEAIVTPPPANSVIPAENPETEENNSAENNTSEENNSAENSSRLRSVVDSVTSSVEWARLDEITDNDIAKEFFKLDRENPDYKDIIIMQCPMSSVTAEIIIIEAVDGKVENALADLNERRTKLIEVDAFYPDSKAIAESSITDTFNNVAYFIAGTNAEESKEFVIQELEQNGY